MAVKLNSIGWNETGGLSDGTTTWLNAGDTVSITYTFASGISLAANDYIVLSNGAHAVLGAAVNGTSATFVYTVASGADATTLNLATSTIYDSTGVAVPTTGNNGVNYGTNTSSNPGSTWGVDATAPTLNSLTAPSGRYGLSGAANGDIVTFTLSFSDKVTAATGTYLTLSDGKTASLSGGNGTNTLTFQYAVGANDPATADLLVNGISGTITDKAGNALNLAGSTVKFPSWDPTASGAVDVICFMAGTRIATPAGEVAVEALRIGDVVLTAEGKAMPVRWIGRQTISTLFADPQRALPIRIAAGALGENLPARDLLLSPDHALLVGDTLIQAGALVNGSTIRRETDVPAVFTYYHVELADHSLVLAEGVPAETFVDNVERLAFDNWDEHQALYGADVPVAEMELPRAKSHRQVPPSVRAQLAARAAALMGSAAAA